VARAAEFDRRSLEGHRVVRVRRLDVRRHHVGPRASRLHALAIAGGWALRGLVPLLILLPIVRWMSDLTVELGPVVAAVGPVVIPWLFFGTTSAPWSHGMSWSENTGWSRLFPESRGVPFNDDEFVAMRYTEALSTALAVVVWQAAVLAVVGVPFSSLEVLAVVLLNGVSGAAWVLAGMGAMAVPVETSQSVVGRTFSAALLCSWLASACVFAVGVAALSSGDRPWYLPPAATVVYVCTALTLIALVVATWLWGLLLRRIEEERQLRAVFVPGPLVD
jgi:hypothetical protein